MIKYALPISAVLLLLSALGAEAQSDDRAYCEALAETANRYIQTRNDHGTRDIDLAVASSQCRTNPAAGIPVLERKLRDNRFTLPKR